MSRPIVRLLVALTVLVVGAGIALPAQAQAYRYWGSFAWEDGAWVFAQAGPTETVPDDGAVEGWRFAVADEQSVRLPRADGDFDTLCADTTAEDGSKRVGVVIDYGTAEDSPDGSTPPSARGACALVPEDANGTDVLTAVADLRVGDGGLICGIDGYPTDGCGDLVDGEAPSNQDEPVELELAAESTSGDDTSWAPVALGVGVIVLVGTTGILLARRRGPDDLGQ